MPGCAFLTHPLLGAALVVDAPGWQWLLVLATAAAYAALLYAGRRTRLGALLASLRFVVVAAVAFLLLSPLLRSTDHIEERPTIAVVVDGSSSTVYGPDSTAAAEALRTWTASFRAATEDADVDVAFYRFAGDLTAVEDPSALRFDGARTDLGSALSDVANRYANRNLCATVLLTDGRTNRGPDPEFSATLPSSPLFAVGLGDTATVLDRAVSRVDHNRIAYLGNTFPVEAVIEARASRGASLTVDLLSPDGAPLASAAWSPASARESKRFAFSAAASRTGMQRYTVRVSADARERNTANNAAVFFVEVLEKRRKVLLVGRAPHPDLGAVAQSCGRVESEVSTWYAEGPGQRADLAGALAGADVVVAHGLGTAEAEAVRRSGKPVLWMVPAATGSVWPAGTGLDGGTGLTHNVGVGLASGFQQFQLSPGLGTAWTDAPPLTAPMGTVRLGATWSPVATARLGSIETASALLAVSDGDRVREGLLVGEGWWRLRIDEHMRTDATAEFDGLVQRTLQYLTSRDDVRRFRIGVPARMEEDEAVALTAEVYDAALDPLAGETVTLDLMDEDGNRTAYVFSEFEGAYRLDLGQLPPGVYRYSARCSCAGTPLTENGSFVVEPLLAELSVGPADHALLMRLATSTGGAFLGPLQQVDPAAAAAAVLAAAPPVQLVHDETELQELIRWVPLLLLLLLLLTAEWTLRRRNFGY